MWEQKVRDVFAAVGSGNLEYVPEPLLELAEEIEAPIDSELRTVAEYLRNAPTDAGKLIAMTQIADQSKVARLVRDILRERFA